MTLNTYCVLKLSEKKGQIGGDILGERSISILWQEIGSSFLPGELIAAFLLAQLESAISITESRLESWKFYHEQLEQLESSGILRRPIIPDHCEHNAHMYYVLLQPQIDRQLVLEKFRQKGINAIFHYVPLHSSPAGLKYCRVQGEMSNTHAVSEGLLRLPLWVGITVDEQQRVIDLLYEISDVSQKVKKFSKST